MDYLQNAVEFVGKLSLFLLLIQSIFRCNEINISLGYIVHLVTWPKQIKVFWLNHVKNIFLSFTENELNRLFDASHS